jgi:hypothetical protein
MMECYEGCEYMQVAIEAGDELLQKYNALIKEREWLLQYIDYLGDCNDARSKAMLGEIQQLRDLPEGLWWPLVSEHGIQLAIAQWLDAYPAIKAKHRDFLDSDSTEFDTTAASLGNVVPFPSRTK